MLITRFRAALFPPLDESAACAMGGVMNKILEDQLSSLLESAKAGGAAVVDFLSEQAPELCRQLVAWEMTRSTVYAVSGVLALALIVYVLRRFRKSSPKAPADDSKKKEDDTDISLLFLGFCALTACICGTVYFTAVNAALAVKCCVAPKVVLVDVIREHYLKK